MTIKVLIVDDSSFLCKSLQRVLEIEPDVKVIGFAHNGQEAIDKTTALKPDVITMDVEMPVMDGIEATRRIMATTPTPILMFSAITRAGAKATLDALGAGAIDFCPKQLSEIDNDPEQAKQLLRQKVRMVAAVKLSAPTVARYMPANMSKPTIAPQQAGPQRIRLIVIAASTGGPVAIQKILTQLPASCPVPILIVQHMPAGFTQSFAERLNGVCQIQVQEAQHGDRLRPGVALIAPGGQQMGIDLVAGELCVKLREKVMADLYAPCADVTLTSIARHCAGFTLSVVLTGMGVDSREGVAKLKQGGGVAWAQHKDSCTIYGMPKAVIDAQLADKIYSLDEIAGEFSKIGA